MDCKGCASKINLTTLKSSLPKDIIKSSEDASQITLKEVNMLIQ